MYLLTCLACKTKLCSTHTKKTKIPRQILQYFAKFGVTLSPKTNFMQPEVLTIAEIKAQYPDQWVLVGNPELTDPSILGSIVSKLVSGVVLLASKDKREIGYRAKDVKSGYDSITCIYTGEIPKNRKWLL